MPQKNPSKSGSSKPLKKEPQPLKNKWYIVSLVGKSKYGRYFILRKYFNTKKQAKKAIKFNFPGKELYYDVVRGDDAIKYNFKIIPLNTRNSIKIGVIKYDYPPELDPGQAKKSFRTKYRRWKRDFNKELKNVYSANQEDNNPS